MKLFYHPSFLALLGCNLLLFAPQQVTSCTVCLDGGEVSNPDFVIPNLAIDGNQNPTCLDLANFNVGENPSDAVCNRIQSHSNYCGCPESTGFPVNVCSLCFGGVSPTNGDLETPLGDTCSELDTYLKFLPATSCSSAEVKRIMTADFICGCPGATAACPMCPDGTSDIAFPDKLVPFFDGIPDKPDPTCQEVVDFGLLIDESGEFTCVNIEAQAGYCGCANVTPSNACPLCKDGTTPVPNGDAIRFGVPCTQLEEYASFLTAAQCATEFGQAVSRVDSLCGCPDPEGCTETPCPVAQPDCAMCPDGTSDITNEDWVVPFFNLPTIQNPTCQDIASFAAIQPEGYDQCRAFAIPAGYCGCADVEPGDECSFCPDGEAPANMDMVIEGQTFTCKDLYTYVPYFSASRCDTNTVRGMQRLGFICGCESAKPECTLCIDGSEPPEPDRVFHEDGSKCGDFVETISQLSSEDCQAQAVALNLFAYRCGCPTDIVPRCVQQNADLCTTELLASTDEECECYSFCDGQLVGCDTYPADGVSYECPGVAVLGCNYAGAVDYVAPTFPPTPAPTIEPSSSSSSIVKSLFSPRRLAVTVAELLIAGLLLSM